ncbi:rCG26742 [Rattus norvegicus]|uniref:RCG26742 n=1 Tax=Rattus norvegicus TaxID=10116 RepID=A6HQ34_RAT|nr:rCG26742 [Rattus norvegicus]
MRSLQPCFPSFSHPFGTHQDMLGTTVHPKRASYDARCRLSWVHSNIKKSKPDMQRKRF